MMENENPYESPKTSNDINLSNKKRMVRRLTAIASILEGVGWSMASFGLLGVFNKELVANLGMRNGILVFYSGAALGIVGIVVAFVAVMVWFVAKGSSASLKYSDADKSSMKLS